MPTPTTRSFSPDDYIVSVGGLPILGFADGNDSIKISLAEDGGKTRIGAGGDAVVTISKNQSGSMELKLLASSDSNDDLDAFAEAFKRQVVRGDGFVEVLMKDTNGATAVHCDKGFVRKKPDITGGADNGDRTWIIDLPVIATYTVGGSVV